MLAARLAFVLAVIAVHGVGSTHAAVYKWVDESGVTHYGEKPPPGKGRQIDTRTPPKAAPAAGGEQAGETGTLQDREREFQKRRVERLEQERKQDAQRAAARAQAKERCIYARNRLDVLKDDRPVYRLDEKGEKHFMEDKVRAVEIDKMKKEIGKSC